MYQNKIIKAVQLIKADAQLSVSGEDIDSIVWLNGSTPIEKSVIEAKIAEMETAEANKSDADKGKDKLRNLGLTDDEIKALIGA